MAKKFIPCHVPKPTPAQALRAATLAAAEDPARWPLGITPGFLAADMARWWGDKPRIFRVGFFNAPTQATRAKILQHANAWAQYCNKSFVEAADPEIRVDFGPGGYWSYLGTDSLGIPKNEPTMNLQGFTERTSEAEYRRVVRHEFGHALGFPHEHMRGQLVARLDVRKTIRYFAQNQGWNAATTRQQVLTPLDERSIRGTPDADDVSIMCYQLPASITTDGRPIRGGNDINELDGKFVGELYPKPVAPPVDPPGEWPATLPATIVVGGITYAGQLTRK